MSHQSAPDHEAFLSNLAEFIEGPAHDSSGLLFALAELRQEAVLIEYAQSIRECELGIGESRFIRDFSECLWSFLLKLAALPSLEVALKISLTLIRGDQVSDVLLQELRETYLELGYEEPYDSATVRNAHPGVLGAMVGVLVLKGHYEATMRILALFFHLDSQGEMEQPS